MKMEEGMQLIDENGKFNVDGLQDFVTATEFAQSGLSYAIVAIIGSQSSGKSTLLNQTFHTKFKEMDAYNGRSQTTKGIWIAKCSDIDPFTIVMDFEGTDSNQRGEDDAAFERQSTLFALEIADVVLINMWCKDIGLEHAASRPLLKTVFQAIRRSSKQPKKTLLFVIRDHTKTPLERLKKFIFEDIEKIWDAVPEPGTTTLYEFFKVEITALPSYEFQEVEFKEQVAQLRQQFVHSTCPGGLVGDRKKVKSASFSIYAEDMWKTIKENKDLDLPSIKVMVATFRCEAIAEEKLKCFISNKRWLAIKEDVQAGPVQGFGEDVTSILETCLSEYDIEVGHFDEEVRNAKQQQLLSNVLMVVHDAYDTMLMHLYSNTVKSFKTSLEQSLNEGPEYVASIHLCSQSCLREFDEGCEDAAIQQSGWNANKFRKRLICNMLSEMMAKYEKQITHAIANTIESLLESSERNTWASVRDVFDCNTEKAIPEFSDAAASFDLRSSEINTKIQHLREYARNLLEMKAREEADAGRVLKRMMDRSKQVFDNYENSMSWYKSETNLDEIERKALSKSLRILSIMAAVRYDEMPDQIENLLYSSLMDRIVLNPSLQKTPMEAVLDPLALDTWEEVSQNSTTLLKPEDCESLWMTFIEEIKPMVTDVKSRQRFFHCISPGGLAGDRKDVQPASGLTLHAEQIWKTIKENKDLDLPAMEVMVAKVRCDQIAKEMLSRLNSDKAWLALRKDVEARLSPKFRKSIKSILEKTLSQYDMEAIHFKESIRDDKRKELEKEALQVLYPAYVAMLRHLRSRALKFLLRALKFFNKVKRRATKAGFEASIDSIIKDTMDKFEKESRDVSISKEWDASAARENLFSEIKTTKYKAKTKFNKAKAVRGLELGIGKAGVVAVSVSVAGAVAVAVAGAGAGAGAGAVAVAVAGAGAGAAAGESLNNSDTANDLAGETFDNSPDCENADDLADDSDDDSADDLADDDFDCENDSLDWGNFDNSDTANDLAGETFDNSPDCENADDLEGESADDLADDSDDDGADDLDVDNFDCENGSLDWGDFDNSDTANDLAGETFDNSPDCEITDDLEGESADDLADDSDDDGADDLAVDDFDCENDSLDWGDFDSSDTANDLADDSDDEGADDLAVPVWY